MIDYFCGYPKCGKSLIAEGRLSALEAPVLYVGTLPNIRPYWDTIWEHRRRRPPAWDLYECTGNLMEDLGRLSRALDTCGGMLIDGGAFYLNRLLQWGCRPGRSELALFRDILARAAAAPIHLVVVDQPLAGMPSETRALGRVFHQAVYLYSERLYFVADGQAAPCSSRALRALDRGPRPMPNDLPGGEPWKKRT